MSEGINVFSMFDGISCGQYALHKSGIKVNKYYAAEIDQRAIKVTQKQWPKTIQYGDVTKIKSEHFMNNIHLLIGGSPCQGFSFAGKQLNFNDPRSKLFFEFVRLKKELNPNYFFLENVRMVKESQDVITEMLGVEPIFVNSSLVSAHHRQRLYWTNIPGFEMPIDRGLIIDDILEYDESAYVHEFKNEVHKYRQVKKASCLDASYFKGINNHQARTCVKVGVDLKYKFEQSQRVYSPYGKSPNIDTMCGGNREIKVAKVITLSTQPRNGKGKGGKGHLQKTDGKSYALDTSCTTAVEYGDTYRKLTPIECERLQGLPDNYTKGISTSARYHALGNGWQVDTIIEFFKNIPQSTWTTKYIDQD